MRIRFWLVLGVILSVTGLVHAQPFVDRVPDDAMFYVGWAGSDALGPAYSNSKLKQFIDGSTLPQLFNETLPALMRKGEEKQDAKPAEHLALVKDVLQILSHHPTAVYMAMRKDAAADEMRPVAGILCDAGADRDKLAALFDRIAAENKDEDVKLKLVKETDFVGLVSADLDPAKTLGKSAAFQASRKNLQANPAVYLYVGVASALGAVESNMKDELPDDKVAASQRAIDASGVRGLNSVAMTGAFAGSDWQAHSYWDAPAPRKGVVKLLEPKPIDAGLLARVPGDAVSAAVVNFDFAELLKTVKDIATAADPQAGRQVQQAFGAVSMTLGRRLDTEIFGPLGSQWAIYASPGQGATSAMGIVAVNKLDDANLAKAAWGDLYLALSNMLPNMMRRQGVQITPTADDKAIEGDVLYSFKISTTQAVPCFTFHNGYMYIGVDPAVLAKAATAADSPKLTEQPKVAAMLKSIEAPAQLTGIRYGDLAATGEEAAQTVDMLWPMAVQAAQREGISLPDRLLPKPAELKALLGPAIGVSWMDEKGFYTRERSPFPGATGFGYVRGDELTAVGVTALGVSVLLPSLNKARETANRVKAASNLRQIGMANLLYSNENKGDAAPDLGTLLKTQDLTVEVFTSPSSATDVPADVRNVGPDKVADWINANSDFVYIKPAGKLTALNADAPVAYEKMGIHGKDGINILFADGHVEFMNSEIATKTIKDATGADPVKYTGGKRKKPAAAPAKPDPAKEPGM